MRGIGFIINAVLFAVSCTASKPQIALEPYPEPEISKAVFSNNSAWITISSVIYASDFAGYDIFLSENPELSSLISAGNINPITNLRYKYYTLPVEKSPGGRHESEYFFDSLLNGKIYYVSVRPVGLNEFWSAAADASQKIFFSSSQPLPLFPRPEGSFILNNFGNTTTNAGLDIVSNAVCTATVHSNISLITNSVFFRVSMIESNCTPVLQPGSEASSLQDLGYAENLNSIQALPGSGYMDRTRKIPVYKNHLYAVKDGNSYYKLFIIDVSSAPASEAAPVSISGRWALQIIAGTNIF
ncbi:MAG TPA: hypothetical protein DC049_09270 [Spirochaetia bacterium]|nr:hypothetical protein [Spirochaetia bacterium]